MKQLMTVIASFILGFGTSTMYTYATQPSKCYGHVTRVVYEGSPDDYNDTVGIEINGTEYIVSGVDDLETGDPVTVYYDHASGVIVRVLYGRR